MSKIYSYRYSVEHYTGDDYDDCIELRSYDKLDLSSEEDREEVARLAADEHFRQGGYENGSWTNGEVPLGISVWVDKNTKFAYNVWIELSPYFYVRAQ